ncbi:hypothetical protein [Ehrlichia canis]|uniref:Uncharacterized protein n=1 Tax=Ehrlichia canis (strain Jake) TaxID=269484 RepID=A0ACA6AW11_EHRCJ|nr:hypothetical protein [Ehrlichia canis]AAZ68539.1 hypothetical protein Ecaj_0503 [Ehrlichia canis str. Jake]AUO54720.1 hypothetical protein C1I72_02305 [Ehrlichia canis]UKC53790.1 hypothetical protein s20019040002_000835 [Ehrlichia canis]UKC54727.1 hypothetical protein s20026770001_000835 [Ehrlichia canis]UKC55663.1 hypothetical protein s21009500007_000835 [Ehrlichia canis]
MKNSKFQSALLNTIGAFSTVMALFSGVATGITIVGMLSNAKIPGTDPSIGSSLALLAATAIFSLIAIGSLLGSRALPIFLQPNTTEQTPNPELTDSNDHTPLSRTPNHQY